MYWPVVIGSAALGAWFIGQVIRSFDQHFEIRELKGEGKMRLLYGLLRLLESSPAGLISTELKLQLCHFISTSFSQLQQEHGASAGYQACVDTAEAQIKILQARKPNQFMPRFQDPERINAGHTALPRYQQLLAQLQQMGAIENSDAQRFQQQLNDRHYELEADSCELSADKALQSNNLKSALRHLESARLSLQQISCSDTRAHRIQAIDALEQNIGTKAQRAA